MKSINDICDHIKQRQSEIIDAINHESMVVYLFLKKEFENDAEISRNLLFQFIYRSFYRLDNAGLTPEFKKEYFIKMQELKEKAVDKFELENLIKYFYKFKTRRGYNSEQFSFCTKLLNILNNELPIYDSKVANVLGFTYKEKKDYTTCYKMLQQTYKEIVTRNLIDTTIKLFDKKFGSYNMDIYKKIDFIFWTAGKL